MNDTSIREAATEAITFVGFMAAYITAMCIPMFGLDYLGQRAFGQPGMLIGALAGLAVFAFIGLTLAIWKGEL